MPFAKRIIEKISSRKDKSSYLDSFYRIEIAEPSIKIIDEPKRMDLLSPNFVALELREDGNLADNFVEMQNQRKLNLEKKSEIKIRTRIKVTVDDLNSERNDKSLKIITLDELAWHDTADDCWVAIYDYVYDCTNFLTSHPGGQDVLLEYAGRDATLAFIGTGHSDGARKILEKYLIGELPICERIFRIDDGVKIVHIVKESR